MICSYAQIDTTFVDNKYLEDQIYIGLTYNILVDKPNEFNQNGLSGGVSIGFIKDIPLNEQRNLGFGIGLGYSFNANIQNLKIDELNGTTRFETIASEDYNSNSLTIHSIEVPLEFRWRTSTAKNYNFWRIYTGLKFSYVFSNSSKYSDSNEKVLIKNINELDNFQYGLLFSAGYSTLNLRLYYGLKPIFKNATVSDENIDLRQFNVGVVFYLL
ncbi:porin family protein [Urechidicola croceus]|nr:porin family protein [Urechidicola croceus]